MLNKGDLLNPRNEAQEIINSVDLKNKRVLEIGCGLAPHAKYLCQESKDYVATDLLEEKIEEAKKSVSYPNLTLMQMDASDIKFSNESFDAVVACHCIHEIPCLKQGKVYNEVHRVLKKGQYFIIIDPVPKEHSEFQKCFDIVHERLLDYNHYYCCAHANWIMNKKIKQEKLFEVEMTKRIDLVFEFASIQEIIDLLVSDFKYEIAITKEQEKMIYDELANKVLASESNDQLLINESLMLTVLKKI